jgi:hypothetical protein
MPVASRTLFTLLALASLGTRLTVLAPGAVIGGCERHAAMAGAVGAHEHHDESPDESGWTEPSTECEHCPASQCDTHRSCSSAGTLLAAIDSSVEALPDAPGTPAGPETSPPFRSSSPPTRPPLHLS